MKAVILKDFGTAENFELDEVKVPSNPEGNVLVRIKATAFNPIDFQIRKGGIESKLLTSNILGRELSGIIVETGSSVTWFRKGDEVMAYVGSLGSNGSYAEFISIPQQLLAPKPKHISFEEAAAIPMVGLTALQCFERLKPDQCNSIFISGGAGGVGTMLNKMLVSYGYNGIFTTAGSKDSKRHLINLGIKEGNIFYYNDPGFIEKLIRSNNNQPFDFCVDLVGGKMAEICSEIIKVNGIYADVTFLSSADAKEQLFDKGCVIVNISNYAYALSGKPEDYIYYGKKLTHLAELFDQENITPAKIHVIGDLKAEVVQEAHRLLEENRSYGKKLVMRVT